MIQSDDSHTRTFTFANSYGEQFTLTVDLEQETAVFGSDDFDETTIENDRIQNTDLILADDEFEWVAGVWRQLFGRELEKLPFTRAKEEAVRQSQDQSGDGHESPGPH